MTILWAPSKLSFRPGSEAIKGSGEDSASKIQALCADRSFDSFGGMANVKNDVAMLFPTQTVRINALGYATDLHHGVMVRAKIAKEMIHVQPATMYTLNLAAWYLE